MVAVEVLVGVGVVGALVGRAYGAAPTAIFLLTALSLAFTVYVVARMLGALKDPSLDVTGRVEDEDRAALEHEKLLLLQGIKELEADAAIGKVDKEDYEHLRAKSEADALRIIRALKDEDERWLTKAQDLVRSKLGAAAMGAPRTEARASAPAVDAASRAATPEGPAAFEGLFDERPVRFEDGRCSACGTDNPEDAHFCVGCGRPRQIEDAAA